MNMNGKPEPKIGDIVIPVQDSPFDWGRWYICSHPSSHKKNSVSGFIEKNGAAIVLDTRRTKGENAQLMIVTSSGAVGWIHADLMELPRCENEK